ncbi:N-acetylglucosaminyldiphosphoundecaprenol N-acetyl-beta-D-mannosaminyltransferase [Catalinimonas alkaloidigena]|uniref:WecB/TagA/CpsF family glycosyltransferase n=1 Tax=Catalinimonas alkaloidigena TaxID=1075417 RepID=UPI002404FAAD|nr:WecB/TagA/CpsF family glycosyltransferase [Catalinimonas alkaloidigena]MDF9799662.1 N-acetylglucosaminyldiphosphoundecaprenol N-acetyl-beta-D-mannosaminyltransferase [Catalinimonas alkaloidigena]
MHIEKSHQLRSPSKKNLFTVHYSLVNYESASDVLVEHASQNNSYGLSALAVHGLIESVWSKELNEKVNKIDMVVPDGQPVRWALNYFHKAKLSDRVYGPTLTLYVLKKASEQNLKVFLYGSKKSTLVKFEAFIRNNYPGVQICGIHADRFRDATEEEDLEDIQKINESGAHIVLVGRGCPRQERWVADHLGKVNAVMMAVGAAFDFHAGNVSQAPSWMQNLGLEWLYRLVKEPKRLWRRYLYTNSYFIYLFIKYSLKPLIIRTK